MGKAQYFTTLDLELMKATGKKQHFPLTTENASFVDYLLG